MRLVTSCWYEVLDIFVMDESGKIINKTSITNKQTSRVNVKPKKFLKFLYKSEAKYVVMAHNHPYGSCDPSTDDNDFTKYFFACCLYSNMFLIDHLIFGESEIYSYYESGKLYDYFKCLKEKAEGNLKK